MSIMDHAKAELERAKFDLNDQIVMLGIIQHFLRQWDSGGSAAVAIQAFNRLIAARPAFAPDRGRVRGGRLHRNERR